MEPGRELITVEMPIWRGLGGGAGQQANQRKREEKPGSCEGSAEFSDCGLEMSVCQAV